MDRRDFMTAGLAAGAAVAGLSATQGVRAQETGGGTGAFKLKYAPHFGMFENSAGKDLVDQLKFAADQGFTAWEDNGMPGRPVEEQERLAKAMTDLGIEMGVFVAMNDFKRPTFADENPSMERRLVNDMKDFLEVAKRVNAKWCTVVPGCVNTKLEWDFQMALVVDRLRRCAEVCETTGLIMVLEPLNWFADHPNLFLSKIPQAYLICRAVDSPSCKILDDLYHQQVTEGNLIANLDRAWDEIAYFQVGDNPGRKEPTTGEINYKNIFKHLHARNFTGIVGMEHGKSVDGKEGEDKLLAAYRAVDDF
jgi:hydroxypyruvate isomerase